MNGPRGGMSLGRSLFPFLSPFRYALLAWPKDVRLLATILGQILRHHCLRTLNLSSGKTEIKMALACANSLRGWEAMAVKRAGFFLVVLLGITRLLPGQEGRVFLRPLAPTLLINNGNPSWVERYGDYIYVVMNESVQPLVVFDVRDPAHPRLLKRLYAPGWPLRVRRIEGTQWLWTIHGNGEGFFDLSDPADPKLALVGGPKVRFLPRGEDNPPQSFKRHPNLTYLSVADATTLFYGREEKDPGAPPRRWTEIYDISDPRRPVLLAKIEDGTPCVLRGNLLFVVTSDPQGVGAKINVYDVSDPAKPIPLTTLVTPSELNPNNDPLGFGLDDQVDYDPKRRWLTVGFKRVRAKFWGKEITDRRAGGSVSGVAVYDVSDWRKPRLLGYGFYPEDPDDAKVLVNCDAHVTRNGYAYCADVSFGLRVFDLRDPSKIRHVYEIPEGGELSASVVIPRRRLLVVNGNITGTLRTIDVSDPSAPRPLGYVHHGYRIWMKMAVYRDRFVYFTGTRRFTGGALFTVDLADPSRPVITDIQHGPYGYTSAIVVDGFLYLPNGFLFHLKDPARPTFLKSFGDFGSWTDIAYREPYLYIASPYAERDGGRLYVIDITDRENPRLVSSLKIKGNGHRVVTMAFVGDTLFLGWKGTTVAVDVADPENPRLLGKWTREEFGLPHRYNHVWSDGKSLFVGSYHRLLKAFDVSALPERPREIASLTGLPSAWLMDGEEERGLLYRIGLNGIKVIQFKETTSKNDPPDPPQPLSPDDGEVLSSRPAFRLKGRDPNGDRLWFRLFIWRDGKVVWEADQTRDATGWDQSEYASGDVAVYRFPDTLAPGIYEWQAFSFDGKEWSRGSGRRTFIINRRPDAPKLIAPGSGEVAQLPIPFRFTANDPDPGALLKYRLTIEGMETPWKFVADQTQDSRGWRRDSYVSGEVVELKLLLPPGKYRWFVEAFDGQAWSPPSGAREFRVLPRQFQVRLRGVRTFGWGGCGKKCPAPLGVQAVLWDATRQSYRHLDPNEPVPLGQGFWVRADREVVVRWEEKGVPLNAFPIPLKPGWNLIASPFPDPIPWDRQDIKVQRGNKQKTLAEAAQLGWVTDYAWGWVQQEDDPRRGEYRLVTDWPIGSGDVLRDLKPWQGYWIYATVECELLLPPPRFLEGERKRGVKKAPLGWSLHLQAETLKGSDGVTVGATVFGGKGRLKIPPSPWSKRAPIRVWVLRKGRLLSKIDFQPLGRSRYVWEFIIERSQRPNRDDGSPEREKGIVLRVKGLDRVPKNWGVWLIDINRRKKFSLRTLLEYRFQLGQDERRRKFRLIVAPLPHRPLKILGLQAYIYRGASLLVRFRLTKPAKVSAELLTVTGRRIALFTDGASWQTGRRLLLWRGVIRHKRLLHQGLYLLRLRATDEEGRQVQATTVVRLQDFMAKVR